MGYKTYIQNLNILGVKELKDFFKDGEITGITMPKEKLIEILDKRALADIGLKLKLIRTIRNKINEKLQLLKIEKDNITKEYKKTQKIDLIVKHTKVNKKIEKFQSMLKG